MFLDNPACQSPWLTPALAQAMLSAGWPDTIPAHTVTQACISSNQAIATSASLIAGGQASVCVAGEAQLGWFGVGDVCAVLLQAAPSPCPTSPSASPRTSASA